MRETYGFVIPEEKFCVDKEGLLAYLGEKIGVGNYSIWNNKQFSSADACKQHMRDTGTCTMLWEGNMDEYEEFYDFNALIEAKYETAEYEN